MKRSIYLLIAMALLLTLLPVVATAAPPPPAPFVTVRDWTVPIEVPEAIAQLSAWDINWRVPKAATIEMGYKTCTELCQIVNEVTYRITSDDKYPQNLDLAGKAYHHLVVGNCTTSQYVRVLDRRGTVLIETWSPEEGICIDPPTTP